jgi:hypothetical protein
MLQDRASKRFHAVEGVAVGVILVVGSAWLTFSVFKPKPDGELCLERIADLGKASLIYASQYDDFLPPYLTSSVSSVDEKHRIQGRPEAWAACLRPYEKVKNADLCPGYGRLVKSRYKRDLGASPTFVTTGYIEGDTNWGPDGTVRISLQGVRHPELSYIQDILWNDIHASPPGSTVSAHGARMNVFLYNGSSASIPVNG